VLRGWKVERWQVERRRGNIRGAEIVVIEDN